MHNWTEQDRLDHRKWARRVAFCYGLAAFLLFGAIAMNMGTTEATDHTAAGTHSPVG